MTDKKTQDDKAPTSIRAGVDPVTEKEARADSREVAEVPAAAFADDEDEDEGLTELPKGAVLAGAPAEEVTVNSTLATAALPGHEYEGDEYFGQGGTFTIDPETGLKAPVFEEYKNSKGKTRYRRVP